MPNWLTIEKLKKATGIDFVSDIVAPFYSDGTNYRNLQKDSESKTHLEMRNHAITYFQKLGYDIYPNGIGVRGVYALADFLAYRKDRVIFVECLTDAKAKQEEIEKKQLLKQFGEVCFVVVGGHGCEWQNESHEIPEVFTRLSSEADVLKFSYGHWRNRFQMTVSRLTPFPRISFAIHPSEKIQICLAIENKRKTAITRFGFLTKTYLQEDENDFLMKIASNLAWTVYQWKRFHTPSRFRMAAPSGKIFKDKNNKLVAQICVRENKGLLKIRGSSGLQVFERLLIEFKNNQLEVKSDEKEVLSVRQNLKDISEPENTPEDTSIKRIESSLYETDQMAWVLNRFFQNRPTKVSVFTRHLPVRISLKINYWLQRALQLKTLQPVDVGARLVADRVFIATDSAISKVKHYKLS